MKISIIEEMKKYHFGAELQSRQMNLVLRITAMIVRNYLHRRAVLVSNDNFIAIDPMKSVQTRFVAPQNLLIDNFRLLK